MFSKLYSHIIYSDFQVVRKDAVRKLAHTPIPAKTQLQTPHVRNLLSFVPTFPLETFSHFQPT